MKKLLFMVLFILCLVPLFSQDIHGYVEMGVYTGCAYAEKYESNDKWVTYYKSFDNLLFIDLQLYTDLFSHLRVGGNVITYMIDTNDITFYPIYTSYTVFSEIFFNNWSIGYEHNCSHEVVGKSEVGTVLNFNSSYDKVYTKFNF